MGQQAMEVVFHMVNILSGRIIERETINVKIAKLSQENCLRLYLNSILHISQDIQLTIIFV